MRFEVGAAFAIGILLPVLETARRGMSHWSVEATTMLEDYLAGAALIAAGVLAERGRSVAIPLLLAAWSGVSGMMTISLVSQVEDTIRAQELEPHNNVVLVFKFLLWATCVVALVRSFRHVRQVSA